MVDAVGATQRLHKILLSWDYWEVNEKLEDIGGVFDKLREVPQTFTSMKVHGGVGGAVACMPAWRSCGVCWASRGHASLPATGCGAAVMKSLPEPGSCCCLIDGEGAGSASFCVSLQSLETHQSCSLQVVQHLTAGVSG